MKRYSLLLLLLFNCIERAEAHNGSLRISRSQHVTVCISYDAWTEEVNKVRIIWDLAEKLAQKLDYKGQILLDFKNSTGYPASFVSAGKEKAGWEWMISNNHSNYLKNAIVIWQHNQQFDIVSTLKLVEYAIQHQSSIKKNQQPIAYHTPYRSWELNSIDTFLIKQLMVQPKSTLINEVISTCVEIERDKFEYGLSYYWQNDSFHFYIRNRNRPDTAVLSLPNIHHVKWLSYAAVVFDTDSSFIYLNEMHLNPVSRRHIIQNRKHSYFPFRVEPLGTNKLAIRYEPTLAEQLEEYDRVMIYLVRDDELIQDLDKALQRQYFPVKPEKDPTH